MKRVTLVAAVLLVVVSGAGAQEAGTRPVRYLKEMEGFAAKDREAMPAPGGVVFVGSSSIRGWKVKEAFPGENVINRGFGGSHIADSIVHFERVIKPYKPRTIIFYAGENDVTAGKPVGQVADDLRTLLGMIRKEVPEAQVVVIGMKPSIARWKLIETFREGNRLMREVVEKDPKAAFVSMEEGMLGANGKPKPEIFLKDGLHMNERGYEIWNKKLRPYVEAGSDR